MCQSMVYSLTTAYNVEQLGFQVGVLVGQGSTRTVKMAERAREERQETKYGLCIGDKIFVDPPPV